MCREQESKSMIVRKTSERGSFVKTTSSFNPIENRWRVGEKKSELENEAKSKLDEKENSVPKGNFDNKGSWRKNQSNRPFAASLLSGLNRKSEDVRTSTITTSSNFSQSGQSQNKEKKKEESKVSWKSSSGAEAHQTSSAPSWMTHLPKGPLSSPKTTPHSSTNESKEIFQISQNPSRNSLWRPSALPQTGNSENQADTLEVSVTQTITQKTVRLSSTYWSDGTVDDSDEEKNEEDTDSSTEDDDSSSQESDDDEEQEGVIRADPETRQFLLEMLSWEHAYLSPPPQPYEIILPRREESLYRIISNYGSLSVNMNANDRVNLVI